MTVKFQSPLVLWRVMGPDLPVVLSVAEVELTVTVVVLIIVAVVVELTVMVVWPTTVVVLVALPGYDEAKMVADMTTAARIMAAARVV
jgi:hypothetical protein